MGNQKPWFSDDIAALLKGLLISARESDNVEYKRGFAACVFAVCAAIGIDPQEIAT